MSDRFDGESLDAGVNYVKSVGYGGSVEALGLRDSFDAGARNCGSASAAKLIAAFAAGMIWQEKADRERKERLRELANTPAPKPSPLDVGQFLTKRRSES